MLAPMQEGAAASEAGRQGRRALLAAAGALAALVPALVFRGFTVDDALITARYAQHLASGAGYRLNAGGPVTDGVTPLGFAFVLAPFAKGGALAGLAAAKVIGAAAWTGAAAVLGLAVARVIERPRGALGASAWMVPFALIATSAPLGAWASSGMETGVVAALGALAAALPLLDRPIAAMACAGIAAGLRPELLPWAVTLSLGALVSRGDTAQAGSPSFQEEDAAQARSRGDTAQAGSPSFQEEDAAQARSRGEGTQARSRGEGTQERTPSPAGSESARARLSSLSARVQAPERVPRAALLLCVGPFVMASAARTLIFGRPAPLSIFAKAPDARLGLLYAAACAMLAGPVALAAPRAFARAGGFARALAASVFVHLVAVALAGGDWMPLSRLVVPVLPSLALAALLLAQQAARVATAARLALAVAGQSFVLVHVGPTAARVGEDRVRVIEELRPALAQARVVASLDIGWVGAATDAAIVDLAGVTDPAIAALPGGHTTKQIPAGLLDARRVDTLVLLLAPNERAAEPWTRSRFARGVEAWIATTPGIEESFAPAAESSLLHLRYLVLRRRAPGP
jgi:hypothetical protein